MIVAVDDREHSAYALEWTMLLLSSRAQHLRVGVDDATTAVGLLLLLSNPDWLEKMVCSCDLCHQIQPVVKVVKNGDRGTPVAATSAAASSQER
ncbi:hypothetical protein SLEP1_g32871 [Rubroshorea leprosula]|uniref:Uncharacterized protein n=1 Tax=Rubroshorea leprosula TaxID=152421 RepID=A0AAV5KES0_9ROSI|nr:hypothetical protein SLEP1_g32871 [Rubroshorea leprosula]